VYLLNCFIKQIWYHSSRSFNHDNGTSLNWADNQFMSWTREMFEISYITIVSSSWKKSCWNNNYGSSYLR